tara:strand:+ start:6447 stop:6665 length:219 start_codon:yes stop_codon:yes gene_type:complete
MVSVSSAVSNAPTDGTADAQQHKRQRAARERALEMARVCVTFIKKRSQPQLRDWQASLRIAQGFASLFPPVL